MEIDKISTFMPIQELPLLEKAEADLPVDISSDDLFLMSKLLEPADSSNQTAKAASVKLRYGDFIERISSDLDLDDSDLHELSAKVEKISSDLDDVSASIAVSAEQLDSKIDDEIRSLSDEVSSNYTLKYDDIEMTFIKPSPSDTAEASVLNTVMFKDGKPLVDTAEWKPVTDLLTLSGYVVANGAAITPKMSQNTYVLDDFGRDQFEYSISNDCYFQAHISALETDNMPPIEVLLMNDNYSGTTMAILNNPGGFSGTKFYNNYSVGFAVKAIDNTKVIIRYMHSGQQTPKLSAYINYIEQPFYGVLAESSLDQYVHKDNIISSSSQLSVCKIKTNQDGLVIDAEAVRYDYATQDEHGFIKLSGEQQNKNNFGVSLDDSSHAYVKVNTATEQSLGVVKLGTDDIAQRSTNALSAPLKLTEDEKAFVEVLAATQVNPGVIKHGSRGYTELSDVNDGELERAVSVVYGLSADISSIDSYGLSAEVDSLSGALVTVPVASFEQYGVVKVGPRDTSTPSEFRKVFVDIDGVAKVNVYPNIEQLSTLLYAALSAHFQPKQD